VTGEPYHFCGNCGSNLFLIMATFENYDISQWLTDGFCVECGARITIPTPVDDPEFER
jgi:hypothetical protein